MSMFPDQSSIFDDEDIETIEDHPIYTSDDERDKVVLDSATSGPTQSQNSQSDILGSSAKRMKLSAVPSLVSYGIDDDDDDDDVEDADDMDEDSGGESLHEDPFPDQTVPKNVNLPQSNESNFVLHNMESIVDNTSPRLDGLSVSDPPTMWNSNPIQLPTGIHPIHVPSQDQLNKLYSPELESEQRVAGSDFSISPPIQSSLFEERMKDVKLPPEPAGHCSMRLQDKVDREVHRMRVEIDYDPNRAIQDNKAFRNPSIYEKLISFLNIDEKGTNFPSEIYDPYRWSPQSYYEELARVQNREIDRLSKIQKEQQQKKSEAITATNGKETMSAVLTKSVSQPQMHSSSGGSVATGFTEPKKYSKWDTGVPDLPVTSVPPPAIVMAPVRSSDPSVTNLPVGGMVKQT